ncbi:DsbA family protein [Tsukamurella paurometabola]|uniref:DSBA-like thioredoxin domain-containing protein n=1 Tax=Tsukamurella paurometabola TaxID=2061 RepID=A0ABS5N7N1_TSUPA|nr:DsbA family protein [Tsukamurella paurometabola]MBS4099942.1 hypothetical protein [Tsukamurella paurometabola]
MPAVRFWFDPVCPYSWPTAEWLHEAVGGPEALEWELMSLAILNEGRELPARATARMRDSRSAGRLFASLAREVDGTRLWEALRAFNGLYHRDGAVLDEPSMRTMLRMLGLPPGHAASIADRSLDSAVSDAHARSQEAAGGSGGSPLIALGDTVFHGPILRTVPDAAAGRALFDALGTVASVDAFTSVQRLRPPT